jgi:hypothetical protein
MNDPQAPPSERALAAWSLREAAGRNPALARKMLALGEEFLALPDPNFDQMSRSHCIGQVAGALRAASGKPLSLEPSEWPAALRDWLDQIGTAPKRP